MCYMLTIRKLKTQSSHTNKTLYNKSQRLQLRWMQIRIQLSDMLTCCWTIEPFTSATQTVPDVWSLPPVTTDVDLNEEVLRNVWSSATEDCTADVLDILDRFRRNILPANTSHHIIQSVYWFHGPLDTLCDIFDDFSSQIFGCYAYTNIRLSAQFFHDDSQKFYIENIHGLQLEMHR